MSKYQFPGMRVRELRENEITAAVQMFEAACEEQEFTCGDFFRDSSSYASFWGVFDPQEIMAGAMMVVERTRHELPVVKGWPELGATAAADSCELAMVAIQPEFRGMKYLFLLLYFAFFDLCKDRGIDSVYAILNRVIHRLYGRLGINFQAVGEEKDYWGDPSFPCHLSLSDLEISLRRDNPELWQATCEFSK